MGLLFIFSFVAAAFAVPSAKRFDREQVFRVKPQNAEQVGLIKNLSRNMQLDFWRPDSAHRIVSRMNVDFRVRADESGSVQALLEQNDMQYRILFHNLQEGIEKQFDNRRPFTKGRHSYIRYNDWKKIVAWTENIADENPKLISRIQIGTTTEERPMYLLKVGKQRSVKKAIFMDCGIHAREWISPAFCQWFVKQASKTFGKDKTMTKLLENLTFYVLPVLNIDGYVWSWTKDRMWRKNRTKNPGTSCVGTDLNRNFDVAWGNIGASNDSCEEDYCGSGPESEKETKAVATFIRDNIDSIKAYISIHSYSQLLLYPFGFKADLAPNHDQLDNISKAAVKALHGLYGTKYVYGPSAITIYPTSGTSADWAYEEGIKYSFTFELRDQGKYGFLLPERQIKPTCEETMMAVKSIANYVFNHA